MHCHAVHFYRDDISLCRWVTAQIVHGVAENQPAIVVATAEHRARLVKSLSKGLDVAAMERAGALVIHDADELLRSFMVGEMPDWNLFERRVAPVIDSVSGAERRTVLVYGEMVDLLRKRGLIETALRLEDCWNHLARERPLRLLCGYGVEPALAESEIRAICWRHTHVSADWLLRA